MPVIGNHTGSVAEGGTLLLSASELSATDTDSPADTLRFTIQSLPAHGSLKKGDAVLTVDGSFTQAELAAGQITYAHNGTNTTSDAVNFTVQDAAGNTSAAATLTLSISAVDDDMPVIGNQTSSEGRRGERERSPRESPAPEANTRFDP